MQRKSEVLTESDIDHFLEKGYVTISDHRL